MCASFRCLCIAAAIVLELAGSTRAQVGGVYIDGDGVLRDASLLSQSERLKVLRAEVFESANSSEVAGVSQLRKVSLRRLEQTVAELHAAGKPLPAEVRHLAGLQEVRYVFFDSTMEDVILAGAAEGWKQLPSGDVVGSQTQRPVLHLDDLIVSLRFAFASNPPDGFLGCSIEPTEEGVRANQAYFNRLGGRIDRTRLPQILRGLEQAVGPQEIKLYGAPPSSRFALQMIAADYRLKRIALGHDPSPVRKLTNYLELASRSSGASTAQPRWWFTAHFDAIRYTPDRLAFELEGQGVKVETGPGLPSLGLSGTKPSRAAVVFAEAFTKQFPEIAEKVPVFNELKNLMMLSVTAALIRRESGAVQQSVSDAPSVRDTDRTWRPTHFLDDKAFPLAVYPVPRQTPSLANAVANDKVTIFSVSGGVEIDPARLVRNDNLTTAGNDKLATTRSAAVSQRKPERWWWD